MSQYDRYRADREVLAALGGHLRRQEPPEALLPGHLRQAALDAWRRYEEGSPPTDETVEQAALRDGASTLALIGLAVERAGTSETVILRDELWRSAVDAASGR